MLDNTLRQRPLALLAALVLAQVLLLAFQIKRDHDVRLIRYWTTAAIMPFERSGTWGFSKTGGIWSNYIGDDVALDLHQLRLRNRDLEGQAGEAQRLSLLLNFHEAHPETPMLAAQVIGASADPASHTLFLNRGDRDHVRRNQAVITPDGIVGKIVEVFPATSQVLLINDKDSGAGALLADTRTHGVVKGSGDPDPRLDVNRKSGKSVSSDSRSACRAPRPAGGRPDSADSAGAEEGQRISRRWRRRREQPRNRAEGNRADRGVV